MRKTRCSGPAVRGLIFTAALLILSGCSLIPFILNPGGRTDDDPHPDDPDAITGVLIADKAQQIIVGRSVQFTAAVSPATAANTQVTWESDNPLVVAVSDEGMVTGMAAGTAQISVTTSEGGYTDSTAVQVVSAPAYTVRGAGPAGGWVFYDDLNGFDFDASETVEDDEYDLLDGVHDGYLTGPRYLEAAPTDIRGGASDTFIWSSVIDVLLTGTSQNIGTGRSNTEAIVCQAGHSSSAAQLCLDYGNGTAWDDWFLPSMNALQVVYEELFLYSTGGFTTNNFYWSSSEWDTRSGMLYVFDFGIPSTSNKNSTFKVRPIRSF